MHKAEPYATSKAVAEGEDGVGVAAVLSQEIGGVAAHQREAGGGAPVLAESLTVLHLGVHALAVLAHDSLEGQAAIDIDGVPGVRHHGAGESTYGGKAERAAMLRGDFARVSGDQRPLAPW